MSNSKKGKLHKMNLKINNWRVSLLKCISYSNKRLYLECVFLLIEPLNDFITHNTDKSFEVYEI